MFSDIFYHTFYIWTNFICCPFGAIPFAFDRKQKRLYTFRWARAKCIRVWMFLALNNVVLLGCIVYFKRVGNFNAYNHVYAGWVLNSIWCLCLGAFALQPDIVCYQMNLHATFLENFYAQFVPDFDRNKCEINHRVDFACFLTRWNGVAIAILETLHCITFARESPFYIQYYIPASLYVLPVKVWLYFQHFSVYFVTSMNLMFSVVGMISTMLHYNHIIAHDLRCCLRKQYRTLDTLRTGECMRITFRSMQILHILTLETSGSMLYPLNWLMMKMIIVCGASFIKYHKIMEPVVKYTIAGWAITGFLTWAFTLEMCGYLFLYSHKAINSWKYHDWGDDWKVMGKFRRSCRPMKVAYHNFFSIKRLSVLKFFRRIGKNLFKALVSL